MDHRLSAESIKSVLDAGHANLNWSSNAVSGVLAGYDLSKIVESENAKMIIQSMPVQSLYLSLLRQGVEDSLAVLPLLSQDQVIRIFDYDAWRHDSLEVRKAYKWLTLFAEVSHEELYRRFTELDEEYQLALLEGKIQLFDEEELEKAPIEVQDKVYALPCNQVFYLILSDDELTIKFIQELIESILAYNIPYLYSLLAMAAGQIPHEELLQLTQFRKARLEEDGFISYEESQQIFLPADVTQWADKYKLERAENAQEMLSQTKLALTRDPATRAPFLTDVLVMARESGWDIEDQYAVHQSLLYLVNGLCSACHIDAGDVGGLNRLMQQAEALVSLGLEFLAGGQRQAGVAILKKEHAKNLFRVGLSLVDYGRERIIAKLNDAGFHGASQLLKWHNQRRWGLILATLDTEYRDILGFETTEILKGLFNRFPMWPVIGSDKIHFELIDSLEAYRKLLAILDGVAGMLYLLQNFARLPLVQPLEQIVATSVLLSAARGEFAVQNVSTKDLEIFYTMSDDDFTEFEQKLYEQIFVKLTATFSTWSVGLGYTEVDQSVMSVVALFKEVMMGLTLARNDLAALKSLVICEERK